MQQEPFRWSLARHNWTLEKAGEDFKRTGTLERFNYIAVDKTKPPTSTSNWRHSPRCNLYSEAAKGLLDGSSAANEDTSLNNFIIQQSA